MAKKSGDDWRRLERHPISAEYEDLRGQVWEDLKENLRRNRYRKDKPIVLYEGKVLDGWQRQRACLDVGIEPVYRTLRKGEDPRALVDESNDYRRHESEQQVERRIAARRARVAELRRRGESIRTIAAKVGAPKGTVQNDLEKVGRTVPLGTVQPPDGKVTSKNGVRRPASRVTKPPPPAAYDWSALYDGLETLAREVTAVAGRYAGPGDRTPGKLRGMIDALRAAVTDWQTSLTRGSA